MVQALSVYLLSHAEMVRQPADQALRFQRQATYVCVTQQCSQAGHAGWCDSDELLYCRDQVPYPKVYSALSVIELEFDWTLTNFAYQAVLRVCAKDASEPAARMALRILDGLRARTPLFFFLALAQSMLWATKTASCSCAVHN